MSRTVKGTAVVLLFMLVLAILYSAGHCQQKSGKMPKFYIRDRNAGLGEFLEGEDIEHVFVVRNHGNGELHILNVRPG